MTKVNLHALQRIGYAQSTDDNIISDLHVISSVCVTEGVSIALSGFTAPPVKLARRWFPAVF
jgi:hypothetical protein